MTAAWWGREQWGRQTSDVDNGGSAAVVHPALLPADAAIIRDDIKNRRPNYSAEWSDMTDGGGALVRLFADQMVPLRMRLNRLPEKTLVDFFRIAGIEPHPAQPAQAMVEFEMAASATASTLIPQGFQIGASAANNTSELVIFETQDSFAATAAKIEELYVQAGSALSDVKPSNEAPETTFHPFGSSPKIGNSLVIGLGSANTPAPEPTISLGFQVATITGRPAPISRGGSSATRPADLHVLRWEALVDTQFQAIEVLNDETHNLQRSGVVILRLPRGWKPAIIADTESPRFWLRVRLIHGRHTDAPNLAFIGLNMVAVRAVRTIRNEVIEALGPVDPDDELPSAPLPGFHPPVAGRRYRMKLKSAPVVPGTVEIEIDTTPFDDKPGASRRWREVANLLEAGPEDRVFTLDPSSGIVMFGDGVNGAMVPPGFRNVRAVRYETGGGRAGAVAAEEIKTLINSAPFVTGVKNRLAASGGTDAESKEDTLRRGASEFRARERAVAVSDYALMAVRADGAEVIKAHAVPAFHAAFPGRPTPGAVTVYVVPPRAESGPPVPDEATLSAVSQFLSEHVAPAGIEVVATAPRYRRVRSEVGFIADPGADVGAIIRVLIDTLDRYLDPLQGGSYAQGWSFGAPLRFSVLMRVLMDAAPQVRAIRRLRLIVDGVPQLRCADVELERGELFWPEGHSVIPIEQEDVA